MIILLYPTKKNLRESIGQELKYQETSIFGAEYRPTGSICGCNRPHITGYSREFFANVHIKNDLITGVD